MLFSRRRRGADDRGRTPRELASERAHSALARLTGSSQSAQPAKSRHETVLARLYHYTAQPVAPAARS